MKSQLLIGIPGVALTLLLAGTAQGQANDLVCTQCVNPSDVANEAIGSAKLKADSVTSEKIGASEVKTGDINAGAVTSEKIGAGEVKTADIADLAISTSKLKAGSVTAAKLDPTMLEALHVKFAGVEEFSSNGLYAGGGCQNDPNFTVTIAVPGPGLIKVDAQVTLGIQGHLNGVLDVIFVYIGSAPDDCGVEAGAGTFWVRAGEPSHSESQYETVPVSRTFTVSGAGTYWIYLNGTRSDGAVGYGGIAGARVEALYFPEL